jgi:O-antigen ligase
MVEARPFEGVGVGAFVVGYQKLAPGDAGPPRTAHNSFMMVAAEVGVPALALFALALGAAFVALARRGKTALARGVSAALFGFLVCSLFGTYAFSWPLVFLLTFAAAEVRAQRASVQQ